MVSNSKQKIVFAEVNSDFVDFWCNLLEQPFRDVLPKSSCSFTDAAKSINDLQDSLFVGNTKSFLTSEPLKCNVCESNKHTNSRRFGKHLVSKSTQEITNPTILQGNFNCGSCGSYCMSCYVCPSPSCIRSQRKVCLTCNRCSYCGTEFIVKSTTSNGITQHVKENVKFILSGKLNNSIYYCVY